MRGKPMSTLLVKSGPPDADGRVLAVSPESAGWRYVGFEVFRLVPGVGLGRHVSDRETCVVVLSGHVHLRAEGNEWHGERDSVFDGPPTAIYVPPGIAWTAGGAGEIAVCTARRPRPAPSSVSWASGTSPAAREASRARSRTS